MTHIGVNKLTMAQIMACRLAGAKVLSEPMLVIDNWTHWNKFQ